MRRPWSTAFSMWKSHFVACAHEFDVQDACSKGQTRDLDRRLRYNVSGRAEHMRLWYLQHPLDERSSRHREKDASSFVGLEGHWKVMMSTESPTFLHCNHGGRVQSQR